MKKSRTVRPAAGVESSPPRRLPLVELLIDTKAELFELAVRSGSRGAQGPVWRTDAVCNDFESRGPPHPPPPRPELPPVASGDERYGYTMCPARSEFPTAGIEATLRDLLNILDGYLVGRPVVELGRARALLRRDRLCALERAAVEQRRRDTRGPEGVAIGRLSGRGPLGG